MDTTKETKERLLRCGVKPSLQRIAILQYLLTHPTHPTAETIFSELYPAMPTLSKTTVYNTLKLLAEQGAILCLNIDEKNGRYDGDIAPHAHFRCKRCGGVYDFSLGESDLPQRAGTDGFLITECQVYYKGYCKNCRAGTGTPARSLR